MMKHTEWWYFLQGLIDSIDPLLLEVLKANGVVEEIDPIITGSYRMLPRFKILKEDAEKYNIKTAGVVWNPEFDDLEAHSPKYTKSSLKK